MMPRLKAEEAVAAIDVTALAMGHYDKAATRQKMRALRDAIDGDRPRAKLKATPAQLAMIGIGVRRLPAPSEKAESNV